MAEQTLQSVAFPTLDEAQISEFERCTTSAPKRYRDGQTLISVGDRDFKFYIVKSGEVEIVDHSGDKPKTVVVHGKGQFTGDVSHLTGRSSVISAVARGDCEVDEVSGDTLRGALNQCPVLSDIILQAFIARRQLLRESPDFIGLRVIGSRYSTDTFRVRDFLAKNRALFTWVDVGGCTIDPTTPNTLTVSGLPNAVGKNKTKVTFKPGKSGEGVVDSKTGIGKDILFTAGDPDGAIGFQNSAFASLDGAGNPSTFTAGVLTDAGELFVTVDANHLANLQGGTIVEALFDLLNPSLPGRGVQIVGYTAGDDILNFTFDPAKTQIAGVIFGTTAESDGVFGTIEAGQVSAPASFWLLLGGLCALPVLGWMSNIMRPGAGLQQRRRTPSQRAERHGRPPVAGGAPGPGAH